MKKSNRKIRQIFYGRIVALISGICIICAGVLFFFNQQKLTYYTTLKIEVAPFYLIKNNSVNGEGYSVEGKDYELLQVFFTAYEADILVLTQNAKGKSYSVLPLSKKIELPALSDKKDNSALTRLLTYPSYTVSKINALGSCHDKTDMTDELKLYALTRIYEDFSREYRKTFLYNDGDFLKVYKIYFDMKTMFEQLLPTNTDNFTKELNILACVLTLTYFEGMDREFDIEQLQ